MEKWKKVGIWVVSGLLAVVFVGSGGAKLAGSEMLVQSFERWGYPSWFMYLVGVIELSGAVVLLVPRLAGYAAVLLGATMVGAVVTHLLNAEWVEWIPASILLVLLVLVGYARREPVMTRLGLSFGR